MGNIACIGFGEVNTPKDILEHKSAQAAALLRSLGEEVVPVYPIQDNPDGSGAASALEQLEGQDFDAIVVCIAGWIPSHTVISVVSRFSHLPMLLWGLTGYVRDGHLVTTADQAGTSALRYVFEQLQYQFSYVYSSIDEGDPVDEISNFLSTAHTLAKLKRAKIGFVGYRDMNLYGTMFDGLRLKKMLGVEIECFELLELMQRGEAVEQQEIDEIINHITSSWDIEGELPLDMVKKGAGLYAALRSKIIEEGYDAISLKDVDGIKKLLSFPPAMVFMLLSEHPKVCTIPENDSLGSVTQLIVRYLTGQMAPYLEFYEFMKDRVLMGVPDFIPVQATEGNVKVSVKAFGDFGPGLLNVSAMKTGRVTMVRLAEYGTGYKMHIIPGEAVTPRRWAEEGWDHPMPQLPSLEIILDGSVKEFAQKVLSQHYIIAYGDQSERLRTFCRLAGIELL